PARRPGPTPRRAHVRRCPSLPSPGSSWPSSGPVRKSDGFRTPLAAAWTHPSVLDVPGAHLRTPGGPSRRPATPDDPPDLRTRPLVTGQRAAHELARRRARQRVGEGDRLGHLVRGQPRGGVLAQLLGGGA